MKKKKFRFILNGIVREVYATNYELLKKINEAFPELKNKTVTDIKLRMI